MQQQLSTHPSIRWRRRSNTTSQSPPRRCSSAVSLSSIKSSSSRAETNANENERVYSTRKNLSILQSCLDFFRFDPLNMQSTSWRNERMHDALSRSELSTDDRLPEKMSSIPHFGYNISFSPMFHYTSKELEPYRQIGDPEMDELLQYLSKKKNEGGSCGCGAFDDVIGYAAMEYQSNNSSRAAEFYKHYYEGVPDWVDFDQIQRGIDVFLAYLPVAGISLFYRSLVGGFSIPQITEVLIATRYLAPSHLSKGSKPLRSKETIERDGKRSEERLFDTGGFLACCFAPLASSASGEDTSAASLRPGGKGWAAALQVRVLHAKVRRTLLRSNKHWDSMANGIPINQEDMAATLLAFSVNVLTGIEFVAGRPLPGSEQRDFLSLWRYVGFLLGVDTVETTDGCIQSSNSSRSSPLIPIDPCGPRKLGPVDVIGLDDVSFEFESFDTDSSKDSIIHSYATLDSMILHLLHPNQNSCEVVSHLLGLRRTLIRSEMCRKFLGNSLSDELHIQKSSLNWKGWKRQSLTNIWRHICIKLSIYFFLLFLRVYTLLAIKYPLIRSHALRWHASLESKYLRFWEKSHTKRMTEAAASDRPPKDDTKLDLSKNSACPFAMVMK